MSLRTRLEKLETSVCGPGGNVDIFRLSDEQLEDACGWRLGKLLDDELCWMAGLHHRDGNPTHLSPDEQREMDRLSMKCNGVVKR